MVMVFAGGLIRVCEAMHRTMAFANAQRLHEGVGAQIRQAGVEQRSCANYVKISKVWATSSRCDKNNY
jgi:hypothetical protein